MKRDIVLHKLRDLKPRLDEMSIRRLALFGSTAREENEDDSDIDLLVDFTRPVDFIEFLTVRDRLAAYLDAPVDLVTFTAAHKPRYGHILEEAIDV